jgi:serine/threonine-protein kinase
MPPASPAADQGASSAAGEVAGAAVVPMGAELAQASSGDDDGPAARASQAGIEALRELPAAQAAAAAAEAPPPVEIAKVSPPPRPAAPPKPRIPTIAVVSAGDDAISSPAEDALMDLLRQRGFRVIDGGHADGSRPNLRALAGRADAVVFVHARPVGSQELQYYGRSSTLYTVQLGVKAYRVSDGSVLWTSSTEQVNFTTLNAAEKAREAVEPMLDVVDGRLAEFRQRERRG